MKKVFVGACSALVVTVVGCNVFTEPGPEHYSAFLSVDATRSPATNAPNASGTAVFSRRRTLLDFAVTVSGLSSHATAAHIHGPAGPGQIGEVLFEFFIVPNTTGARLAGGVLNKTVSPEVSFDSLLALMRNGSAYVDVHTELNPNGEISGDIQQGDLISAEP